MLLNTEKEEKIFARAKFLKIFAIITAVLVFAEIAYVILLAHPSADLANIMANGQNGTVETIGHSLYTDYIVPFEAAGFLLLAAAFGALLLANKKLK